MPIDPQLLTTAPAPVLTTPWRVDGVSASASAGPGDARTRRGGHKPNPTRLALDRAGWKPRDLSFEVLAADAAQEKARAERPHTTRDRDAAVRGIVRAVGVISALGALEFADDEAKRSQFVALVSRGGRPPKAPEPEAPVPPVVPMAEQAPAGSEAQGDR